ncbi:MAG: DNA alkylation repair protein [Bacilli bacterium]|nr:DNA alkylation repair protein [Bacilli bacterium]
MIDIRKELFSLKDEKYKEFQEKLLPGINNFIGVRMPDVRKVSKKIPAEYQIDYIKNYNCKYLEEYLIKGLFISNIKDINIILKFIEGFIKEIDNWEVCDLFVSSLKIINKNKALFFKFITQYFYSDKEFEKRFALVILLNYYICDDYIDRIFNILENIRCKYYYDKMAQAWLISNLYIQYKDRTLYYLNSYKLEKDVYNMSIRKIMDSNKVSKNDKELLRNI